MRSEHVFSRVPSAEIQRSSFDRSCGHKTTLDAGYLVPIFVDEVLPGDTFNLSMTGFARLATPIFPMMDNAYLESFWFFVPYRLVWENWERFNGAQDDPDSSTDFLIPQVLDVSAAPGGLFDYLGIPPGVVLDFSALPSRAYNLIYREWFRDQNLQDSPVVDVGDGPDDEAQYVLRRRGKRHDYFTSCLPWPQKGEAVGLPIGGFAPVVPLTTTTSPLFDYPGRNASSLSITNASNQVVGTAGTASATGPLYWDTTGLQADLASATLATINSIRQAFQVQRLLERDARGGTRYTEIVRSHFRVVSPDARLQRPEYLGGGSSPLIVSQVPNTTADGTTPQGTLAAYGTVTARNHGFTQSFTEHGVILGLVSVRADLTYQQGIERMWSRRTRYDFFWPALSHLGEQAVLNKEIFADGSANDDLVFGYQERYAEYRYKPSRLSGLMRSSAAGTLDAWHLAQNFSALPVLGDQFIQEDPPFDRVIAVPSEPHFIFDCHINLRCARPMPVYGVPGLIDHF